MKYKYRHREVYNDVQLDIRANTQSELIRKTNAKKKRLDKVSINPNTTLYDFGIMFLETYKRNSVSDYWYENLYHIFKKICTIGETIPVSNIKPIQIQNMLNACSNLSDSYVKKIYDLTCQLWHYTYKNGLTEYDYSEDLKSVG